MTEMGEIGKNDSHGVTIKPLLLMHSSHLAVCLIAIAPTGPMGMLGGSADAVSLAGASGDLVQVALGIALLLLIRGKSKSLHVGIFTGWGAFLFLFGLFLLLADLFYGLIAALAIVSGALLGAGILLLFAVWGYWFAQENTGTVLANTALAQLLAAFVYWSSSFLAPAASIGILISAACLNVSALAFMFRMGCKNRDENLDVSFDGVLEALSEVRKRPVFDSMIRLSVPMLGVLLYALSKDVGSDGFAAEGSLQFFIGALVAFVFICILLFAYRKRDISFSVFYVWFPVVIAFELLTQMLSDYLQLPGFGSFLFVLFALSGILLWAALTKFSSNDLSAVVALIIVARVLTSAASLAGAGLSFLNSRTGSAVVTASAVAYLIYALVVAYPILSKKEKTVQIDRVTLDARIETLSQCYCLTPRETEILRLLSVGHGSPYIAEKLFISENTARSHIKSIYRKMAIGSREELIAAMHSTDGEGQ